MNLRMIVTVTVIISAVSASVLPSLRKSNLVYQQRNLKREDDQKYSSLLKELATMKLKLQSIGYGPPYLIGPYPDEEEEPIMAGDTFRGNLESDRRANPELRPTPPPAQFDEMEILQLVPVIIEQKRKGNISPEEEQTLKGIFGDLWTVIDEEVHRQDNEEMNPLLKALLQSREIRLHKRALLLPPKHDQWQDDVQGNELHKVKLGKSRWPKQLLKISSANLSPQQRLMRYAALLIRQWFDENSPGIKMKVQPKKNLRRLKQKQRRQRRKNRRANNRRRMVRKSVRPKRHNKGAEIFEITSDDELTLPQLSSREFYDTIAEEKDLLELGMEAEMDAVNDEEVDDDDQSQNLFRKAAIQELFSLSEEHQPSESDADESDEWDADY